MRHHKGAALTVKQREEVARLYQQGVAIVTLAQQFGVSRFTIRRWAFADTFTDRSSAPKQHGRAVAVGELREAIVATRRTHPHWGPQRIAAHLKEQWPTANNATVWRVLHQAGLSASGAEKKQASP